MKIQDIQGVAVAFDGCHKIYIIKKDSEMSEALESGYTIHHLKELKDIYKNSCPLKFISSWDLKEQYIKQGEKPSK